MRRLTQPRRHLGDAAYIFPRIRRANTNESWDGLAQNINIIGSGSASGGSKASVAAANTGLPRDLPVGTPVVLQTIAGKTIVLTLGQNDSLILCDMFEIDLTQTAFGPDLPSLGSAGTWDWTGTKSDGVGDFRIDDSQLKVKPNGGSVRFFVQRDVIKPNRLDLAFKIVLDVGGHIPGPNEVLELRMTMRDRTRDKELSCVIGVSTSSSVGKLGLLWTHDQTHVAKFDWVIDQVYHVVWDAQLDSSYLLVENDEVRNPFGSYSVKLAQLPGTESGQAGVERPITLRAATLKKLSDLNFDEFSLMVNGTVGFDAWIYIDYLRTPICQPLAG